MDTYSAKQITEILVREGANINLRTVRYYTQIGIIPTLDLIGNKRVYTNKHLIYFRAILTLSNTGSSLSIIQETLKKLTMDEIKNISEQLPFYQSDRVVNQEVYKVNDDIFVALNRNISPELRNKVIESVTGILRGGSKND